MKNKVTIALIIGILIVVGAGVGIKSSGILDPYEQQIKLGYKLMNEGNYEEAILAFNKAIDIDTKQDKAYIGIADTYVTRCDETTVADASEVLKRGYEQAESENIKLTYIRLAELLNEKEKLEWAIALLQNGYELTRDERLRVKKQELIDTISTELLKQIYALFESNELEGVRQIMGTDEFVKISKYIKIEEPIYYFSNSTENSKEGKGVGIYRNDECGIAVYYGNYDKNIRNGNGTWMYIYSTGYYLFNGNWENDIPNGYGETESYFNHNGVINHYTDDGNLSNGLWNGTIRHISYQPRHGEWDTHYINGIVTVQAIGKAGEYQIANSENGSVFVEETDVKVKCGVSGFID